MESDLGMWVTVVTAWGDLWRRRRQLSDAGPLRESQPLSVLGAFCQRDTLVNLSRPGAEFGPISFLLSVWRKANQESNENDAAGNFFDSRGRLGTPVAIRGGDPAELSLRRGVISRRLPTSNQKWLPSRDCVSPASQTRRSNHEATELFRSHETRPTRMVVGPIQFPLF